MRFIVKYIKSVEILKAIISHEEYLLKLTDKE